MINAKIILGLFLVVFLTSGIDCDDHGHPGCPPDHPCPPYVVYKNWEYRFAYCSKYIPCHDSPYPTCVFNSGWQYWCFEKEDGKLVPVPVIPYLDDQFKEIQNS